MVHQGCAPRLHHNFSVFCVHARPFTQNVPPIIPENPRLIQFHINHNSNVFRVHARSFARFHCFSRPCASFRTSSILVASIRVLASMRALSCSARPRFGSVTCVSHVLRCARAHAQSRLPSNGSAGLRSRPCAARGTPRTRSGTPRASCSSVSADRRIGRSGPHPRRRRARSASSTV